MTSAAAVLRSGSATDQGLHRERNEDRIWADDFSRTYLVVDGLGGHAGGELAAQTAVDAIVRELKTGAGADPESAVRAAIAAANNDIYALAQQDPANAGMACVLTLAVFREERVTVGHVGDSRLYLVWNGGMRKLTSDHSPVGELEDGGELTDAEAMQHPRRNEVFRDVGSCERGPGDHDFIEIRTFPFHSSAALLLCTDGLSDALTSAEIGAIVQTFDDDAAAVAQALVKAANLRGGNDNVSVIFVPGPDFVGAHGAIVAAARTRHAITRMRAGPNRWKRAVGRTLWLMIGILLGMAMLAGFQQIWAWRGLIR